MTTQEFSNEFDVLYNNIRSNQAPGLDDYEKSVFLTKAQEEIIVNTYNGNNPLEDSFESTEEIRRYLSSLIKTHKTEVKKSGYTGLSASSTFFELPSDLWFITYESVDLEEGELKCADSNDVPVIPVTQDEYHRVKKNPFRGFNERRVLRLDENGQIVELVSKYNIKSYLVKYISKPSPIIISDLPDGLKINNISKETPCELNPIIHRAILDRAVKLAIISGVPNIGK